MFPWLTVQAHGRLPSRCGCIHAVTSEYGFKLAVGVNTVLHALTAGKVKMWQGHTSF